MSENTNKRKREDFCSSPSPSASDDDFAAQLDAEMEEEVVQVAAEPPPTHVEKCVSLKGPSLQTPFHPVPACFLQLDDGHWYRPKNTRRFLERHASARR